MRTLDICIPTYNEASIIAESVRQVKSVLDTLPSVEGRVVVADNGSTDGTSDAVTSLKLSGVVALTVPAKGKGAALVYAARQSTADIFGFIDADLSADPKEIGRLLQELSQRVDIVIGSRLLDVAQVKRGFLRTLSSRIFNLLRRAMLGISVVDTQCGLKLMNTRGRDILRACVEQGWFLDLEFLARAERARLSVRELPIAWDEFHFPGRESKLSPFRDGIKAVAAMVRIRARLLSL